ncbi:MAG: penicillin-binding protein 2 [Bacteroidetes bacterium]|nr:penicillin-binding protein 2 [Bacteroidota bacterium]
MDSKKKHIIQISLFLITIIFISRLFFLQIINNEYKIASQKNTIQKKIEYPYRGEIYDRNNKILVYNEPTYNLNIIPKIAKNIDKNYFCKIFNISIKDFEERFRKAKSYSKNKPSVFLKNIFNEELAKIQDYISEFKGFYIEAKTLRGYTTDSLANTLGYLSEINLQQLKRSNYYSLGDYIGTNGIEKKYEKYLRGTKGITYKLVDVDGIEKGSYQKGKLNINSLPGKNIKTTIDINLQKYMDKLMKNKIGSIVIIEPNSGEILAIGSYPSYDPKEIKGNLFGINFKKLQQNENFPLFNRAIMAMYPPGSIFKIIQALIALEEKVINKNALISCDTNLVKCHRHQTPSNLFNAIKNSCNPYFYKVFRKILLQKKSINIYEDSRIGFKKWRFYVKQFGFGSKTEIDIPGEKKGFIPTIKYYDKKYGKNKWKTSTIRSLDIGQGELLVTPIQMVNLIAIFANRGFYYTPHIVKEIGQAKVEINKKHVNIKKEYFEFIADAMEAATSGTARRAKIKNIDICCKTGTAENPHGKDHSVFFGFAPKYNPKIAIAVYVENAGWGGIVATSIGGLLIEKYVNGFISKERKWYETYILNYKQKK